MKVSYLLQCIRANKLKEVKTSFQQPTRMIFHLKVLLMLQFKVGGLGMAIAAVHGVSEVYTEGVAAAKASREDPGNQLTLARNFGCYSLKRMTPS